MKKFKTSVFIVMAGTLLSKVLGLIREVLLAQKYGTGYISDSFILSLNIPTVIISAVATAILTNYIPLFSKAEKESEERAAKFNGNLLVIFFIISTILILLFMAFTKPIVKIFAVGFDDTGLTYLVNISRITIFCMYFIILAHIFKGYLEYRGKFLGTALYGILMNVGMILGIVFSSTEKYQTLGLGVLLGYILAFIALFILSRKNRFTVKFNLNLKDDYLKELVVLTIPILLNDVVWQINGIVDKSISSTIGAGYISAINYSHYIVDMVTSVFATSVVTVFFPNVIKLFNEKGIKAVKEKTNSILKLIVFISIPATVLISVYSRAIVRLLFYRGAFDENSLQITSVAVSVYALAIVFVSMKTILFKVFYALQDTKSPTKSAIISILLNIALSLILVKPLGYIGIIIGTVVSSFVSTFLLIKMFNKNHEPLLDKNLWTNILRIVIAAVIMLGIILITNYLTSNIFVINELVTEISKAIIGGAIGGIAYLISLAVMKYNFKIQ